MTWAHIQDMPGSPGTGGSASASSIVLSSFGSAVTVGDILVVYYMGTAKDATNTDISVTDNASNTYTRLFYAFNVTSGSCAAAFVATAASAPSTITVSSVDLEAMICSASEFSGGTTTTDGSNTHTASATTATPGSITTTVNGDLLITVAGVASSTANSAMTTPTGYTTAGKFIDPTGSFGNEGASAWQIQSTAGAINQAWTLANGSHNYAAGQVALKAAASAAAPWGWQATHPDGAGERWLATPV